MNALLISDNINNSKTLKANFEKNYEGLKIRIVQTQKAAIDYFIDNPNIAFFILDASFSVDMNLFLSHLIDLSGNRPIIICNELNEDVQKIFKGQIFKKEEITILSDFDDHQKINFFVGHAANWYKKNYRSLTPISEDDEEYLPFKIRNLYLYESFPNDLYVKVSENNYMVTFESNTPIKEYQIQKLVKRRVKLLYISKTLHIEFLENSMKKAMVFFEKSNELDRRTIMTHLKCTALVQDYLVNLGVTEFVSEFIDSFISHIIEVLSKHPKIKVLYQVYKFKFQSNTSRSLLCAYVSYYLVNALGWKSETVNKKFLFASIIQDSHIENDDLARVRTEKELEESEFEEEEKSLYLEHPRLISEMASQFSQFPDVDFLLANHHVLPTKDGFPRAPSSSEIQMAVCVFIIATNFAREIDGMKLTSSKLQDIYKNIFLKNFDSGNFKEPVTKLKKLVYFD